MNPDDIPQIEELPEQLVEAAVEPVRHRAARRLRVLHEVGRREVQQIERPRLLRHRNPDLQA